MGDILDFGGGYPPFWGDTSTTSGFSAAYVFVPRMVYGRFKINPSIHQYLINSETRGIYSALSIMLAKLCNFWAAHFLLKSKKCAEGSVEGLDRVHLLR